MFRNSIKIFHSIYEMKYFFIYLSLLSLISLSNSTNPKLCVDCKFFKRDLFGNKFGKCFLFEKTEIADKNDFLVDGIVRRKNVKYHYCSTARQSDNMCGKDGKLYEKNNLILFPMIPLPPCPLNEFIDNIRNQ